MRSKKKRTRPKLGSTERAAKQLALDSARLRRVASDMAGRADEVDSKAHGVHMAIESFHNSTGDLEKSIQNVEIQNRLSTAKSSRGSSRKKG